MTGAARILATEDAPRRKKVQRFHSKLFTMTGNKNEALDTILAAILRRNGSPSMYGETQEDLTSALQRLHIVRLDREGITKLSNLEAVKEVHSLYLQENQIKKIENLDVLKNLQFLSLSGNRIENVQNLRCLQNLQFLDLSNNLIQKLNAGELPQNLMVLDMSGNPCTKTKNYRQQVLEALPLLQELDGVTVKVQCKQKPLREDSSDSDDASLSEESDSLSSLAHDMVQRSHQRRKRALREHEDRLTEMNDSKDGQSLLSSQDEFCSAKLQGIAHQNQDTQDKGSSIVKKPNDIKSNKNHQAAPSLEKNVRDFNKVGKAVFRNQTAASSTQFSAGVSSEKKLYTRYNTNTLPSRTLPSPKTQTKHPQTSKHPAKITQGTTSCTLKERQTTKNGPIPEKAAAPRRSTTSAPNQRPAVSAKKL
ncbi:leucine-rich repeat-containing protein 46 [Pyxicephalus adspersus]|uniref:leucine-rich repeat-containing protein 46 n=1 Tax=Pyxicephalus adspersus TaxID=30357 RepID=UPI003B5923D7